MLLGLPIMLMTTLPLQVNTTTDFDQVMTKFLVLAQTNTDDTWLIVTSAFMLCKTQVGLFVLITLLLPEPSKAKQS